MIQTARADKSWNIGFLTLKEGVLEWSSAGEGGSIAMESVRFLTISSCRQRGKFAGVATINVNNKVGLSKGAYDSLNGLSTGPGGRAARILQNPKSDKRSRIWEWRTRISHPTNLSNSSYKGGFSA